MSQSGIAGKQLVTGISSTASSDPSTSTKKGNMLIPDVKGAPNVNNGNSGVYATSSYSGLCVTSEEINFLVYRYLQESGFVHSAFTFAYESSVSKNSFKNADVPPGALITFLQKGLQYLGIEENLNDDGSERKRKKRRVSASHAMRNGGLNVQNNSDEESSEGSQDSEKFSLLSPHACRALGRKNPPIKLSVPPATATAVVTAKMAAEAAAKTALAKQKVNKNPSFPIKRNSSSMSTSESSIAGLPGNIPPKNQNQFSHYPAPASISPGRNVTSVANFNAAAAAAAMSQMHRQGKNMASPGPPHSIGSANNFPGSHQDSYGKGVTLGNLPIQNRNGAPAPNPNLGQAPGKASDIFLSSLASSNAAMVAPAFKANVAKPKTKTKTNTHPPSLPITGNPTTSVPKQNQSMNHLHSSLPGAFTPQQSWSAALDEAAVRIEANTKAMKLERDHGINASATQQPVQLLMNAAAAGSLAGTPASLSAVRSQSVPVAGVPTSNNILGNKLIANPMNPSSLNAKNTNLNQNAAMQSMEKFRNISPAIPGRPIFGNNTTPRIPNTQPQQPPPQPQTQPPTPQQQPSQQIPPPNQLLSQPNGDKQNLDDSITQILPSEIVELSKHTSEVFMCSWNQVYPYLIATGSGDASARIWQMNGPTAKSGCGTSRLLKHGNPTDKNKDVTTLEWSPDGNQLATGSYDGVARVWTRTGDLVHTLRTHRGPIFSLKWNKRGNYLLSGSYDKTTIVWDVSSQNAFVKQQFDHHFAPALDVDWKDDNTFASCSTDKCVHICRVGSVKPIFTYTGHTDEVNAVKWDPSGTLLASCSDDCTAKVWDVSRNRNVPLYDFKSHKQEIYTVKWSPTGKGSLNPTKSLMLATASFDGTVRLWNIQNGTCIRILSRHRDSVYSVSFSPSGEYLASGSLAGQLYIWNVKDGNHVKSYKGEGDIFEVAWNKDETRVAACFSSNVVAVIDFKR